MIEFLVSDYLLKILANMVMAQMIIGLGIVFFVLFLIGIKGLWRLFNDN